MPQITLDDAVRTDLQPIRASAEACGDCGLIASSFLLDGPRPGMYSKAATRAGIDEGTLSNAVEAFAKIYLDSIRLRASDSDMRSSLVEHAGFSDEAAAAAADAFKSRKDELAGFIPGAIHYAQSEPVKGGQALGLSAAAAASAAAKQAAKAGDMRAPSSTTAASIVPEAQSLHWRLDVEVASRQRAFPGVGRLPDATDGAAGGGQMPQIRPSFLLRLDVKAGDAKGATESSAQAAGGATVDQAAGASAVGSGAASGSGAALWSLPMTSDFATLNRVRERLTEAVAELRGAHFNRLSRYAR